MQTDAAQKPLNIIEMGTQFGMGGISKHILGLTEWLRAHDHRVTLAGTADIWAGPDQEAEFLELPTRYVAADGGSVANRMRHAAIAAWRLRRWLAANPADLIHCHESAPALVANLARVGRRVPVVVTYHGSEPDRIAAFGGIAAKCDLVITPSHRSAEDLASIGKVPREKLRVIGLGVAQPPNDSADEIAGLRAELLGDGERLIVTLARLQPQKGIDILIDCVARMKNSHPGYRFVVAGDGPDEAMLHARAQEKGLGKHLRFIGRTDAPIRLLRAADLFLLTSRWEALPFTIAEAFQAGTPAVAAACSGVVELIDGRVGAVVPIGDVDAICAAVAEILSDEPRRRNMAENALERSREDRFNPDWVHRQFEKTYYELARAQIRA
ncbi:glycosyltransferase family 4 protein [Ruegeria sediminis]|uniref:Glycosyltransferase family 4 protein n=1 Tax=Ruegeria sediminis TaxID=2583820 RepID=A0ABY2WWB1_9RHOB|nr:glycosyltransferase family 4 protein [Ruegeria sediminis]TMV07046.1 glycosyltransferase family 4 protein [Ruegeria sediminis]